MWYGKDTPELLELKRRYKEKFGHNPDGEMSVHYGDPNQYIKDINEAIETNEVIARVFKKRVKKSK